MSNCQCFWFVCVTEDKDLHRMVKETEKHILNYAMQGLRTLCMAKKVTTGQHNERCNVPVITLIWELLEITSKLPKYLLCYLLNTFVHFKVFKYNFKKKTLGVKIFFKECLSFIIVFFIKWMRITIQILKGIKVTHKITVFIYNRY